MPTIYDVAKQAAVSVATVSRAFRGHAYVRPEVRDRVIAAAKELGYRPNRVASALAGGKTNALGLLVPSAMSNPFYGAMAEHLAQYANELGFELLIGLPARPTLESYVGALIDLEDRHVDGLLVCADAETVLEYSQARREGSPPMVAIGCSPDVDVPVVTVDEEEGGYLMTRHLLAEGHRKIGFLCLWQMEVRLWGREHGYVRAMVEAGLKPIIHHGMANMEGGHDGVRGLMGRAGGLTAIMCHNDMTAIGALQGLYEAGVSVPEDVAVAGFDNLAQSRYAIPPLTTVNLPVREMARMAIEALRQSLTPGDRDPMKERILLNPTVVVRESTGRVGAGQDVDSERSLVPDRQV
jgi:DNA-binding LacI/PurR family transcriptional regulator